MDRTAASDKKRKADEATLAQPDGNVVKRMRQWNWDDLFQRSKTQEMIDKSPFLRLFFAYQTRETAMKEAENTMNYASDCIERVRKYEMDQQKRDVIIEENTRIMKHTAKRIVSALRAFDDELLLFVRSKKTAEFRNLCV